MLKRGKKGQIVISLGDDGAIATCFENGLLVKRYFASGPYANEFTDLVKQYPNYPVYLILDTIDQNYVFSTFPALRSSNLMKMVNRKIANEFDPNDINAFLPLGKDESSVRKDLKYVFVTIRDSSPLTDWLEVFEGITNRFMGIYLFPLESSDYIKQLKKNFPRNMGEGHKSKWQILISHNRVGGFRQVVFRDDKIIFTRISQASNIQSPDSVGLNISQEAANTLEYIRRIGFSDSSLLVYIVASKESFQFIEIPGVEHEDMAMLTPFEISEKLSLKGASQEGDKFGDVIFASSFLKAKPSLKVTTKKFKEIDKYIIIDKAVSITLKFLVYVLPLLILYYLYSIYSIRSDISGEEDKIKSYKSQLSKLKNFEDDYGINPQYLVNIVGAAEKASHNHGFLKRILPRVGKALEGNAKILNYDYKALPDNQFSITVNTVIETEEMSDNADLIIKAQQYVQSVKNEFEKDYGEISFSNLPTEDNIKFDNVNFGKVPETKISFVIKGAIQ